MQCKPPVITDSEANSIRRKPRSLKEFMQQINNADKSLSAMTSRERKYGRLVEYSIGFLILLIAIGIGLYYTLYVLHVIPLSSSVIVKLAVATAAGLAIITLVGREVSSVSRRLLGEKRGSMLFVVFRFVAYTLLALVILALAGVSGTDLLAGGTFAGLVLGLAGQTVLSNIIAGVMIILARPYEVDDRVTFLTWQFGLIAPAYPPKFYSNDFLMPGYSGKVSDIGLAYSTVALDEGTIMKIPNSLMVQAAIVSHEIEERVVRTKYEVPSSLDPELVIGKVEERIRKNQWVTKPDSVKVVIEAMGQNSYVIAIDAVCKGTFEAPPRSSILLELMKTMKELQSDR